MTYAAALNWLYAQTRHGAARDPERMRRLVASLGLALPTASVHVVGTNGKGSVAAMLANGYSAAGQRAGLFISPHVEDFRERISVDGQVISEREVVAFVEKVTSLELDAAFFELCFALALEAFSKETVDLAVVEAGVGARSDATSILGNVRAVVITNVALDHQETLGPTLRAIAEDKAEAIRPGVPIVTGAQGEALEVVSEVAAARNSPLYVEASREALFDLPPPFGNEAPFRRQNQRLAAATLRLLGVPESAVIAGLSATLPGRRERFEVAGRTVILDGGHNPAAAAALKASLRAPYLLVFGALPKKQGRDCLALLAPDALATLITEIPGYPNPALARAAAFVLQPEEAVRRALEQCPPGACVVVTGSFYLVGHLRPWLRKQAGQPSAQARSPADR